MVFTARDNSGDDYYTLFLNERISVGGDKSYYMRYPCDKYISIKIRIIVKTTTKRKKVKYCTYKHLTLYNQSL